MQNSRKVKIQIRGLEKSFGEKKVLDGVDLDIYEGESVAVIGASGTGKSVLIKHVIGLLRPDNGMVTVDDINVQDLSGYELQEFMCRFGMLFQGGALFDSMSVFDNVAFPLRERGVRDEDQIRKRVDEMLNLVDMDNSGNLMPSDLSGGMRKRIGLARALAPEPNIMLYDEPTTGLDPVVGGVIDRLIVRTRDRFHVTSITITHDIRSAYRIAHRIAMLYNGKIIKIGTPEEMRSCSIPEVEEFVADRTAHLENNLFQAGNSGFKGGN
ncbi:ABC transporter ATP-binding protein [bacterium]|nr:ABC transporter ATP-binding protein [candidate division CSSED10-310 bacterium]